MLRRERTGESTASPTGGWGRAIPTALSLGRIAVGVAFAVKPVASLRLLGVDPVTASRVDWLARMTAARDLAIGIGGLRGLLAERDPTGWLLAGALCDALDATAVASALAQKKVALAPAVAEAIVAISASAAGLCSLQRRRDPAPVAS